MRKAVETQCSVQMHHDAFRINNRCGNDLRYSLHALLWEHLTSEGKPGNWRQILAIKSAMFFKNLV